MRLSTSTAGKELRLLNHSDEIQLAKRIEAGIYADFLLSTRRESQATDDELRQISREAKAAYEDFFEANIGLVVNIAKNMVRQGFDFDELFQQGCVGLAEAIYKFDYKKGVKFSSFAYFSIKQNIQQLLLDRFGTGKYWEKQKRQIIAAVQELYSVIGYMPKPAEIAKCLDIPISKVKRALLGETVYPLDEMDYLNKTVGDNDFECWVDDEEKREQVVHLRQALSLVEERYVNVLQARFGIGREPLSVSQMAGELGVCETTVRRWSQSAIKEVRHVLDQLAA